RDGLQEANWLSLTAEIKGFRDECRYQSNRSARLVGLVARMMTGSPGTLALSPVRHQSKAPDWCGCVKLVAGPRYHRWRNFLLREKFRCAGELSQPPANLDPGLFFISGVHDHGRDQFS
ncbi:MAG TPA: hypothetical protein VNZ53_39115, partial [Steroidobacteraceae bacterium]|nr:hypothetical protein [Steroidobacteraceae bacterium]